MGSLGDSVFPTFNRMSESDNGLASVLGKLGKGVVGGIDFVEKNLGDPMRSAAERGVLGAAAPNFQAGVSNAMNRRMQEAYQKAMLEQGDRRLDLQERGLDIDAMEAMTPDATNRNVQSTFRGDNGNMWLVTRDGRTVDTEVPFSTNVQLIEGADGSVSAIDKTTGVNLGQPVTPDEARDAKVRSATGDAQADATVNLPDAVARTSRSMEILDRMENHPGLSGAVGAKNWSSGFGLVDEPIGGSKEADFVALTEQVGGEAFLQAFQELKGGGHITEVEGLKAEQAIARIRNRKQSEDAYKQSIKDLKDVLSSGLERQKRAAQGDFSAESDAGDDFANMTDEQLRAIINGE